MQDGTLSLSLLVMPSHSLQLANHARRIQARGFADTARRAADKLRDAVVEAADANFSLALSLKIGEAFPEEASAHELEVCRASGNAERSFIGLYRQAQAAETLAVELEALAAVAEADSEADSALADYPDSIPPIPKWPPTLPLGRLSPCNTPRVAVAA